jgi:hypothetical protein
MSSTASSSSRPPAERRSSRMASRNSAYVSGATSKRSTRERGGCVVLRELRRGSALRRQRRLYSGVSIELLGRAQAAASDRQRDPSQQGPVGLVPVPSETQAVGFPERMRSNGGRQAGAPASSLRSSFTCSTSSPRPTRSPRSTLRSSACRTSHMVRPEPAGVRQSLGSGIRGPTRRPRVLRRRLGCLGVCDPTQ